MMLNKTTTISPAKTVGEIQQMLAKKGVRKLVIDYDESNEPIGLTFSLLWQGIPVYYALPCRWEGVLSVLKKTSGVPRKNHTKEHAQRVAWRVLKDWIEAQLAIAEAELASLPEIFLPYAITRTGETVYNRASPGNDWLQLMSGQ